jgi:hypothetical protein
MDTQRLAVVAAMSAVCTIIAYAAVELFPETIIAHIGGLVFFIGFLASIKYVIPCFGRLMLVIKTRKYHDETR